MSDLEQELKAALADDINEEVGVVDKVVDVVDEDEVIDPDTEKATGLGWKPKDNYEGDPDNWRPAKQFLEYGDLVSQTKNMQKQIQGMKKNHNEQISNLNLFHRAQLDTKEKDVEHRLNKAVEDGDTAAASVALKEHNAIQKERDKIQAAPDDDNPQRFIDEWEMNNEWAFDKNNPKTGFANKAFSVATNKGMTVPEALEFVDSQIALKFPSKASNTNLNRLENPSSLQGKSGAKSQKLSMSQVSSAELKLREIFSSDDSFLTAVSNSRKGV